MQNFGIIYVRQDESYLINDGMYHVPDEGEWRELYAKIKEYAEQNPDRIIPEQQPL